jgi:hypothetical protein
MGAFIRDREAQGTLGARPIHQRAAVIKSFIKNMKGELNMRILIKHFFIAFMISIPAGVCWAALADYGPDGLKDATEEQKAQLAQGKIIFFTHSGSGSDKLTEQQSAVVLNKSPEESWNLLYPIEDQPKFVEGLEEVKVIARSPTKVTYHCKVKLLFLTINYRLIYDYEKPNMYFTYHLDPTFKNDVQTMDAWARFYPYGQNQTLYRQGSKVAIKWMPSFFIDWFLAKPSIERTFTAVKKYVDSGGTYHK